VPDSGDVNPGEGSVPNTMDNDSIEENRNYLT
jgi:hypothetical protein